MASHTEELHRLNRAIPIAFALIANSNTSEEARRQDVGTKERNGKDSKEWRLAAHLANIPDYVPSFETQNLIIYLLGQYEAIQKRIRPKLQRQPDPEVEYLDWAAKEAVKRG